MAKAVWNDATLAHSDETIVLEGNHYFPPASLSQQYFRDSGHHTVCGWKGTANYYDVVVGENVNKQAAWYYPDPKPDAENIKDYVAFWKAVAVEE